MYRFHGAQIQSKSLSPKNKNHSTKNPWYPFAAEMSKHYRNVERYKAELLEPQIIIHFHSQTFLRSNDC